MTALTAALSIVALVAGGLAVANRLLGTATVRPDEPRIHSSLQVVIPSAPRDLALGSGSVWAATDTAVVRVDSASGRILARWAYPSDGYPSPSVENGSLAFGAGAAWTILGADGRKSTVGPIQSSETTLPDGTKRVQAGTSIRIGPPIPGYKPWWGLFRVDAKSGRSTLAYKDHDSRADSVSAGPTGVWIGTTDRVEGFNGALERFDPKTGRRTAKISIPQGRVISIDATSKDVVAVIQTPGDLPNRLIHIDPAHGTIADTIEIPGAYAVGVGRGQAWVMDRHTNFTTVVRVLLATFARTGSVRIPADVANFGVDLAVTNTAVWVVGEFPHKLFWIDPTAARIVRTTDPGTFVQYMGADEQAIWLARNENVQGTLFRFDVSGVAAAR